MSMNLDYLKATLRNAAERRTQMLCKKYPTSAKEALETYRMINEVIDTSFNETDLIGNLKRVGDDLLEEDFCEGYDRKGETGNSAIFEGMLATALQAYGALKTGDTKDGDRGANVISLAVRRAHAERYSEDFSDKLTQVLDYYRAGFDAMHALNAQIARAMDHEQGTDANMYGCAYSTLKELHPDLDDEEIGALIDDHIHAVLQHFLEDSFCDPLGIDPDDIPAAKDLPLHSFLLISKTYEVAKAHAIASKLPEGTDMFDARLMREVRPMLKDLQKKDHYQCADAGDFLATMDWLNHSLDMAKGKEWVRK